MRTARLGWTSLLLLAPGLAGAYPNDVDYSGLIQWEGGCDPYGKDTCNPVKDGNNVIPDQRGFDGLAEEMGVLLAPRDVGPASTGGQAGFDLAAEVSIHTINNRHNYWAHSLERSARADKPDVVWPGMGSAQVWLKKGLPYSFQVAGGFTQLFETRIMALGLQGKWTLNEGFFWFPDLALTVGASKSLCLGLPSIPPTTDSERSAGTTRNSCSNDLDLFTVTTGAVVSKTFSLLGMLTVSPYAGWQKIFVHSFSPFIDRDETTNDRAGETFRFRDYKIWGDVVGQECGEADVSVSRCLTETDGTPQVANLFLHRNKLYAGLRFHLSLLEATLQGEVTHVRGLGWSLENLSFYPESVRLSGVGMPDLQMSATARVGFLF
ncbi:MAG: hypothetical protein HY904_04410 [Deltaproteobacteria bacterium]|nr:hypothetical protein [Deltaproteobacteria bacterium]